MCCHIWGTGGMPEGVGTSSSMQGVCSSHEDAQWHRKLWLGVCCGFGRPGDVGVVSNVARDVPKGVGTPLCVLEACGSHKDTSQCRDTSQHVGPWLGNMALGPDGLRRLGQYL